MRKSEIESILDNLDNIKNIASNTNYNILSAINKELIQITPILKDELKVVNGEFETNSPKICLIDESQAFSNDCTFEEFINMKINELVEKSYEIIDFGICGKKDDHMIAYIKYNI